MENESSLNEKEKYNLRPKDLVPLKGLITYMERVGGNYDFYGVGPKMDRRVVILGIYNAILLGGAISGIVRGLEKLLQ